MFGTEITRRLAIERTIKHANVSSQTLSILLLGKRVSENCRLGNVILNTDAFKDENPPNITKHQCSHTILTKSHVAVINNSVLLQKHLSDDEITEAVKQCEKMCAPGPHVFILALQYEDFSEGDMTRVKCVLRQFNKEAMKQTIVITTDEESDGALIHSLIKECAGGHIQFKNAKKMRSKMFNKVKTIMKRVEKEEQKIHPSVNLEDSDPVDSDLSDEKQFKSHKKSTEEKSSFSFIIPTPPWSRRERSPDGSRPNMSRLNVVVCGRDSSLKSSISELILQQTDARSEGVRTDVEIHGRHISLAKLPDLSHLSEDEVMHQTLRCLSLFEPGVHAFLYIVSVGPVSHENKEGIEKIQRIFDSRDQLMVIFMSEMTVLEPVIQFVKAKVHSYGFREGQYKVIGLKEPGNSRQIPELLDYIEKINAEPLSLQMYVKAQGHRIRLEIEEKYKEELKRMENEIKMLRGAEGETDDPVCLRIVLIGRTGSGKSATGNTILGRNEFKSCLSPVSVTTVCKKGIGEIDGQSVAVVDTPGIFDTKLTNELVWEEMVKCVSLSAPGPHVFVIVLSLGRFTKEEKDTIDLIKKIFGRKAAQFSIVLFTRGDELEDQTIEDYVCKHECAELQKLIGDCGNRFLAFNNREKQDRSQVIRLLQMIEEVKTNNQGRYFTNIMFEEAEMSIKKRMEEILEKRETDIQKEKEELQAKYQMEMQTLKKRLEEEKQRAEEERRKMENHFSEQEEKLKKDFEERGKCDQKKRETEKQKRLEEEKQQRAEYHQTIEKMKREIDNQRSQYEKQQKQREKDHRRKEERYRQDLEKMKNETECAMADLKKKHERETKMRNSEERKRIKQEEKEREEWMRKMKKADNERKETQEEIKQQQREWEDEKRRKMKEREEEERKRKEKHEEQLREKQEELEKMRKRFEREREEERQKMEDERQIQIRERGEKEREYEEKRLETKRHYEQLERERKEEWERRKLEDEERREEERKRWKNMIEDLKREQEDEKRRRETEEKERQNREENERDQMRRKHEEEIKQIKKKHADEARKQAEELNDFKETKEQYIQELKQTLEERQEHHDLLEKLYQHFKDEKSEEVKELKKQIEDLKNRWCSIM